MTENIEYIDKVSYEALKENLRNGAETNSKWNPYYIKESYVTQSSFGQPARKIKQAPIFQKKDGPDVPVFGWYTPGLPVEKGPDGTDIEPTADKMIEELNRQLNIKGTDEDIKKFLLKEKKERTEESQESKKNSEMVQVGETYEYQGKNGKTQVGEISNTQGKDGEDVNKVELLAQKTTPEPTGGKRKSKKSKKSKKTKKSKKSKTRKNSRKTNRRR